MSSDAVILEKLVQKIQQHLAPSAKVEHNVRIVGRNTGVKRQIDVLVTEKVGQYDISIAIECKDYSRPVDVKGVEQFIGMLNDVGVHQGVLVCPKGFTEAAKVRADGVGMMLYSLVDTGDHKWKAKVTIPAICDFRFASIGFGVSSSAPLPFRISPEFFSSNEVFDLDGNSLGTAHQMIAKRWNDGEFEADLGHIERVDVFGEGRQVQTDNGYGQLCPVDLYCSIAIGRELFSGSVPVETMSGFRDELSGMVITNAFSIGLLNPDEIVERWKPIADENDLPELPPITVRGLVLVDEAARVMIDFGRGIQSAVD